MDAFWCDVLDFDPRRHIAVSDDGIIGGVKIYHSKNYAFPERAILTSNRAKNVRLIDAVFRAALSSNNGYSLHIPRQSLSSLPPEIIETRLMSESETLRAVFVECTRLAYIIDAPNAANTANTAADTTGNSPGIVERAKKAYRDTYARVSKDDDMSVETDMKTYILCKIYDRSNAIRSVVLNVGAGGNDVHRRSFTRFVETDVPGMSLPAAYVALYERFFDTTPKNFYKNHYGQQITRGLVSVDFLFHKGRAGYDDGGSVTCWEDPEYMTACVLFDGYFLRRANTHQSAWIHVQGVGKGGGTMSAEEESSLQAFAALMTHKAFPEVSARGARLDHALLTDDVSCSLAMKTVLDTFGGVANFDVRVKITVINEEEISPRKEPFLFHLAGNSREAGGSRNFSIEAVRRKTEHCGFDDLCDGFFFFFRDTVSGISNCCDDVDSWWMDLCGSALRWRLRHETSNVAVRSCCFEDIMVRYISTSASTATLFRLNNDNDIGVSCSSIMSKSAQSLPVGFVTPPRYDIAIVAIDNRSNALTVMSFLVSLANLLAAETPSPHQTTTSASEERVGLYLFCSVGNEAYMRRELRRHDLIRERSSDLHVVALPELERRPFHVDAYSALLKSSAFWQRVKARKCLMVQDDGVLVRPGARRFLGAFDYVGAPWMLHQPRLETYSNPMLVGNGGLSVRNVDMMTAICREGEHDGSVHDLFVAGVMPVPEDVYFSARVHRRGGKIPGREEAAIFASEQVLHPGSLGFHKPWAYHSADKITVFFENIITSSSGKQHVQT